MEYDTVIKEIGMGYVGTTYNLLLPLSSNLIEEFEKTHKK
jgi:hypothetical protein